MNRFVDFRTRHGRAPEDFVPEGTPSFTLESHIESLRRDKTPEELARLYAEWEQQA
jgi:hypothetical protein